MQQESKGGRLTPLDIEIGVFLLYHPQRVVDLWDLLSQYEPEGEELTSLIEAFRMSLDNRQSPVFVDEYLSEAAFNFWATQRIKYLHVKDALERLSVYRNYLEEKVRLQQLHKKVHVLVQTLKSGVVNPRVLLEKLYDIYSLVSGGEREITSDDVVKLLMQILEGKKAPKVHPFLFFSDVFGYPVNIYYKDLTVVAGRTGRGKTTVSLNLAHSYLLSGKKVCYISTEMDEEAIATKFASIVVGVPWDKIWGNVDPNVVQQAISALESLLKVENRENLGGVFFYHAPYCTISHIAYAMGKAKAYFEGEDLDCVIVDYIQQVDVERVRKETTRAQELGSIARQIADLAVQYNCAAVVVSQVNDAGEVKDSRAIAERAALVIKLGMLSPEGFAEYLLNLVGYPKKKAGRDIIKRALHTLTRKYLDVCIAKNRYGVSEPTRVELIEWNPQTGRILGGANISEVVNMVNRIVNEVEMVVGDSGKGRESTPPQLNEQDLRKFMRQAVGDEDDTTTDTSEPFTLV